MTLSAKADGHSKRKLVLLFVILGALALMVSMASRSEGSRDYHWSRTMPESSPPTSPLSTSHVLKLLNAVIDPELGISVVDLGLIYDFEANGADVKVVMTLTSPQCPLAEEIIGDVKQALFSNPAIDNVHLHLTFDPPWTLDRISPEAREKILDYFQGTDAEKETP